MTESLDCNRRKVYHFHNGKPGGVFSVIDNILYHKKSPLIDYYVIYTINKEDSEDFKVPELTNVVDQKVFYYSSKWNFYYTVKKLSRLIKDEFSILVAHDWLELGMISNLGLSNPVVHLIHGDYSYYYELVRKHCVNVDSYFCISSPIYKNVKYKLGMKSVYNWRFPVKNVLKNKIHVDSFAIGFFVGDLTSVNKNYRLLPLIDKLLSDQGIYVNWRIAGGGMSIEENISFWGNSINRVRFYGLLGSDELNEFLAGCNAMILPSEREGLPLSVVEAMKRGIIPFVSYWNGSLDDLVIDGVTGFYAEWNNASLFASKIQNFYENNELRLKMPDETKNSADRIFDPTISTQVFEECLINLNPRSKIKFKAYGSRLDNYYMPNLLVSWLRSLT